MSLLTKKHIIFVLIVLLTPYIFSQNYLIFEDKERGFSINLPENSIFLPNERGFSILFGGSREINMLSIMEEYFDGDFDEIIKKSINDANLFSLNTDLPMIFLISDIENYIINDQIDGRKIFLETTLEQFEIRINMFMYVFKNPYEDKYIIIHAGDENNITKLEEIIETLRFFDVGNIE